MRVAVDEGVRRSADPLSVDLREAGDVVVLKVQPLGGVRAALRVAEAHGLPCVVSSALESSVGIAAGVALAAALPELPFACGLATVALFTLMMDAAEPAHAGADYTLLACALVLGQGVASILAGTIAIMPIPQLKVRTISFGSTLPPVRRSWNSSENAG